MSIKMLSYMEDISCGDKVTHIIELRNILASFDSFVWVLQSTTSPLRITRMTSNLSGAVVVSNKEILLFSVLIVCWSGIKTAEM